MKNTLHFGLLVLTSWQIGKCIGAAMCTKCYKLRCNCFELKMEAARKSHNEYMASLKQQSIDRSAEYDKAQAERKQYYKARSEERLQRFDTERKEREQRYNIFMEELKKSRENE